MANKCRLCAKSSRSLESVFSFVESGRLLLDLIHIVCPIKIDMSDELPKEVCEECKEIIVTSVQLRELSVKSDLTFRMKNLKKSRVPSTFTSQLIKQELDEEWNSSGNQSDESNLFEKHFEAEQEYFPVQAELELNPSNEEAETCEDIKETKFNCVTEGGTINKPAPKKLKGYSFHSEASLHYQEIVQRIVNGINGILSSFKYDDGKYGHLTVDHVELTEGNGKTECSVRCLFCDEPRKLCENGKGRISVSNFKKHLNKVHIENNEITKNLKPEEGSLDAFHKWSQMQIRKRRRKF